MAIPEADYAEAFMMAGQHLQSCMDAAGLSRFRWLKMRPSRPAFADLIFALDQRVYAVILVAMTSQKKVAEAAASATFEIPQSQRELLMDECERYHLEPLVFPLWTGIMQPLTTGWNLFSLRDMEQVDPTTAAPADIPIAMSEWELSNFRVELVMQELKDNTLPIYSYQDIPGVYPNIWFRDETGQRACVAVVPASGAGDTSTPAEVVQMLRKLPPGLNAYIARVGVSNADAPGTPPARAQGLYAAYRGMEKLN